MVGETEQKSLLQYPCFYHFKAIGKKGRGFPEHVRKVVAKIVGPVALDSCRVRVSEKGTYESVTIFVQLTSEEMRRAVYFAFWNDDRVLFYL